MGIRISQADARQRLEEAYELAVSDRPVPGRWTSFAELIFAMAYKTYTPALGTVLLARATDDRIDPLSIKAEYGENTYSLRTLGHEVLVPAARRLGFSIRNTGREPLNNQPFFRYDHMTVVERVRDRAAYDRFVEGVSEVGSLSRRQALVALAAFLRVAIAHAEQRAVRHLDEGTLSAEHVIKAVDRFLSDASELPRKVQALVAAAFDVTHKDVRSRKLNDPSRDFPGDVQAFDEGIPLLAAEARAKKVSATEVIGFVAACNQAGIDRAFMIVFSSSHTTLPATVLRDHALESHGVVLTIIERPEDLLFDVLGWSDLDLDVAVRRFSDSVVERLREIEATDASLDQWISLAEEPR